MFYPTNTLPANTSSVEFPLGFSRRESVEIVGETDILETPGPKRRYSCSTYVRAPKPTKWNASKKMSDKVSGQRYFHGICYRASVNRRRADLTVDTMQWTKLHLVVLDDVIVFFSHPNYDFESRVHFSKVKSIKRVRISGKSTTYFGAIKPFVVRFQTRAERNNFRHVMTGNICPNKSVNLSTVEPPTPIVEPPTQIAGSDSEDDDVFLPSTPIKTILPTSPKTPARRRIHSDPSQPGSTCERKAKVIFRSLRKFAKNAHGAERGFLDTLRRKSRALKNKFK